MNFFGVHTRRVLVVGTVVVSVLFIPLPDGKDYGAASCSNDAARRRFLSGLPATIVCIPESSPSA